jgi:hypothetical protein
MKNIILSVGLTLLFALNAENEISQTNVENVLQQEVAGAVALENNELPVITGAGIGENSFDKAESKNESVYKPLTQEELKQLTESLSDEEKKIFQEFIDFISNSFSSWKKTNEFEAVEKMLEAKNINLNILISIIPSKKSN